jgi:hypothetical protein
MVADTPEREALRNDLLRQFEQILSEMGVDGGACKIVKDPRQEKGNRPQKVSLKHPTARKLVSLTNKKGQQIGRFWKRFVPLEPNKQRRKLLTEMWLAYEKFAKYLQQKEYSVATGTDPDKYDWVVDTFLKRFLDCWQEGNVTHYMVSSRSCNSRHHEVSSVKTDYESWPVGWGNIPACDALERFLDVATLDWQRFAFHFLWGLHCCMTF